ncbi:MAG: Dyp-type peroxidase [Pseudomonadota bacterium]
MTAENVQPEQPGIFRNGFRHFHMLEYRLAAGTTRAALLQALRAGLTPDGDTLATVAAFGAAWTQTLGGDVPVFEPFREVHGRDGFTMPATHADLMLWLQGSDTDVLFDAVHRLHGALAPLGEATLDLPCFTYHDSRDLTGFVDGIGNPQGRAARHAARVPDGQPGAGGSFVLTQRWVHDLTAFHALPVAAQEAVIGRTKADAEEFDEARMPKDAHVARTDLKIDGEAMKIWRRSMPYGTAREHGLYFLAFSCRPGRYDVLLQSMAGNGQGGIRDRLTDFSRPVTGGYWYAPAQARLAAWLAAP